MSIFNRGTGTNVPSYSGYDTLVNGDLKAIQEGYEDQLAIIESIHALEMEEIAMESDVKALKENGSDDQIDIRVNEFETVFESAVGNVWEKIKSFFVKMWGKLKQFFSSVVRFFDGMFKSGKDFATKYEKQLRKLTLTGFKYKMHTYNLDSNSKAASAISVANDIMREEGNAVFSYDIPKMEKMLETMDDKKDEIIEKVRGAFVGGGSKTSEEFNKELYSHFRNGADSSDDMEEVSVNIGEIITALKSDKFMKMASDAEKDAEKVFKEKFKLIDERDKAASANTTHKNLDESKRKAWSLQISGIQKYSSLFSEAKSIALDYFRAWKTAVSERDTVYKNVCTSAFRYKQES